jgi:hypothetical protein
MTRIPFVLRNVARWHNDRADEAIRAGNKAAAERHETIAFRLFREARDLREAANRRQL